MSRLGVIGVLLALTAALPGCADREQIPPSSSTPTPTTSSTESSTQEASAPPAPDELRVAISDDQPGLGEKKDGTYTGLDADVARFVAAELGVEQVTFIRSVPDQRDEILTTGQADLVIAAYSMTEERAERVRFAGPYLVTGQDLLVPEDSTIRSPKDLRGRIVCGATGASGTVRLVDRFSGLRIAQEPTVAACVQRLRDGDVDAVTSDATILAGYLSGDKDERDLKLTGKQFSTERYGIGMRPEDEQLCERVTDALETMVRSGAWRTAVRTNLPPPQLIGTRTYVSPKVEPCLHVPPEPTEQTGPEPASSTKGDSSSAPPTRSSSTG